MDVDKTANSSIFTFTNTAPDTGTPAITSNGSTPSLNSGITAAEIRSLIGAGTGNATVNDTGTPAMLSNGATPTLNSGISSAEVRTLLGIPTTEIATVGGTHDFNNLTCDQIGVNVAANGTDGRIDASNDIVAFATSDERLKENVKPLENALLKVSQLSGVEFDWKELTAEEKKTVHGNEGHDVGVIAQEVEKVLPEVVTERENGYKAVKYEKMVPLLIEAIKELTEQNKELKSEVEILKSINSR